ncbi:MAG: ABC transporter substrate-binding protein [Acidobacteriia bacterium]|nr:ABC transporter substrate-binding protein [Terriglobia bacterium]
MFAKCRLVAALVVGMVPCALTFCPAHAQQKETIDYLVRSDLGGTRGGSLIASVSEDPATFNLMFAGRVANVMVAEPLSADLVHINRRTYELEPSLATGWEAAKDGRTYTIHLRRGLRFSDGRPFTADDVVFTLNALQDSRNPSTRADQFQADGKFPAIAKVDDFTVLLSWPRAVGTGLRSLDSIPMLPKNRLVKTYQEGALASAWGPTASPQEVAGLGPFRLKEYQRGVRIVLERNPFYWKKDKAGQTLPYLDTLTFLIIPDRNAEALRFEAGEIDVLGSMNSEHFARLRRPDRTKEYTVQDLGAGLGMDFMWFNLNPGKSPSGTPFLDPEKQSVFEQAAFRQAVSCALDREAVARSVYGGLAVPQYGPISSGNRVWYNTSLRPTPFDPKRARALLAQISLKDTNGDGIVEYGTLRRPLEIVLLTTRGNATREKTAEIIRQYLAQVGIRVNVQLLLMNELAPRFSRSFDYEAILLSNTPTDVVPDLQTDLWYSSGGNHFWYPEQSKPNTPWEAEVDSLTTRLVQSLDDAVRKKAFFQVQEIWAREMPAIATVAPNILTGWRNNLGNIRPSILVPYLLWNVEELTKRTR